MPEALFLRIMLRAKGGRALHPTRPVPPPTRKVRKGGKTGQTNWGATVGVRRHTPWRRPTG
jgi:hypothetical protein